MKPGSISRPMSADEFHAARQSFDMSTRPLFDQIAALEAFRPPPTIILHPNGRVEIGEKSPLPEPTEALIAQLRAMIDDIAAHIYGVKKDGR